MNVVTWQAMMVGCIPVVIADEIEFPYENSVDWRELTVKIPESRSEETISILRSIPKERIFEKQEAIKRARLAVTWKEPPVEGDAFHSTLKEIGRKRRNFKASTFTFWN
ncbi:Glycerol kinase [Cymbomonas tetramitiformis]|uniref:Glycerol kinase n=1 Tax=Cymbomonas tetramitiformis TaxID=36881 RepID=A0AAE0FC63_9CHLO|nr:Glycerol kinase [Cymbomonas tetramitiformis]